MNDGKLVEVITLTQEDIEYSYLQIGDIGRIVNTIKYKEDIELLEVDFERTVIAPCYHFGKPNIARLNLSQVKFI